VLPLALFGSVARADYTIEETVDATNKAMALFRQLVPEHIPHFVGYKVWKSGEDLKVKVYITHEGASLERNFFCHKHDNISECHDM